MIERILKEIATKYPLMAKPVGEFQAFKASGMKFVCSAYYTEGLLSHGGAATDVLKKELGDEKTAKLLRSVLFGTE